MIRFIINDIDYAWQVLDNADIPFDLDDGNRIMISEDYAEEVRITFAEADVSYDEI